MKFEFWLIIGISLVVGLLSTSLTSPLLWRNLHKRKTVFADAENNGINPMQFLNGNISFIGYEFFWIFFTFLVSALIYFCSRRFSLFCGGSLAAVSCVVAIKIHKQVLYYTEKKKNKKVIKILFGIFAIYLVFFAYDNTMFSKAKVDKKIDEVTLSEEILPETLTISAHDMMNLINSSINKMYSTNGKLICYSLTNYFTIIDEEGIHWLTCDSDPFSFGFDTPVELHSKNPKKLGIGISDQNNVYFVYALLSQDSWFSEYKVSQYALYDPFTKQITYSDIPPQFLD